MTAAQLDLRLAVADADAQELDEDTQQLRRELLALDVEDVRVPAGAAPPPGTRGVDAAQVGALVVALMGAPGVLAATVATVQSWVSRRPDRTVELTIDGDTITLNRATQDEQDRLVRAWLARHA